jgi:hypothetical protein
MPNAYNWVKSILEAENFIEEVSVRSDESLRVVRSSLPPSRVAILSTQQVELDQVTTFIDPSRGIEFIANVPSSGVWTPEVTRELVVRNIAFGGIGDLRRALREEQDVRNYIIPNLKFVQRGLQQHDKVLGFDRLGNFLYEIQRRNNPTLRVVFIPDYELTGESLRAAKSEYSGFSIAVGINPNAKITSNAYSVAERLDLELLTWAEFYGRINKK